jgi:hypothetical protein
MQRHEIVDRPRHQNHDQRDEQVTVNRQIAAEKNHRQHENREMITRPPIGGTASSCCLRPPGSSTSPIFRASTRAAGINASTIRKTPKL